MEIQQTHAAGASVYSDSVDGTSIRLLRISHCQDGTFKGKLKTFRLSEAPPFFTASYTWGSRTYSKTTVVLRSGSLPVLASLVPFLNMISQHEDFVDNDWWWIDSLCINLSDGQERERQVRIMAQIYKRARRAIIWLGEEVEGGSDCRGAINFLQYLANLHPTFTTDSRTTRATLRGSQYAAEWTSVSSLLTRPWWTRVWTLQEFILPKEAKLYCGSENSISRGKFKSAMYSIFLCSTGKPDLEVELVPRAAFDAAFNRRRIHQWFINPQSRGMSLVAIMAYLGNHSASDSRDRLYSVLGLITARDRRLVGNPEYTSSVERLYTKLVRSFWNEYQSLDIICFSHIFSRYSGPQDPGPETAVPSFAPDWRATIEFASPVPLMASQSASEHIGNFRPLHSARWRAAYNAPGKKLQGRANVRFHENLKEMWCDGVILDTIDSLGGLEGCGTRCRSFICSASGHGIVHSAANLQQASDSTTLPLDILEAISRSLVLDRQDKYLRFPAPRHYFSDFLVLCHSCLENEPVDQSFSVWFHQNKNLLIGKQSLEEVVMNVISYEDSSVFASLPPPTIRSPSIYPTEQEDAESDEQDTFLTRFSDVVRKKSRRLMITRERYAGMAPCRARHGDVVAILFGCSIPLVLRRVGMREAWQVIGESYAHGFMNGETDRLLKRRERAVHKFRLV